MKSRSRRIFFCEIQKLQYAQISSTGAKQQSKSKLRVTVLALNTTVNTDPEPIRRLDQSITAQKHNIIFVLLNVSIRVFVSPLYIIFCSEYLSYRNDCTQLKTPIVKPDQGRRVAVCVYIDFPTCRAGRTTIAIFL